MLTTEQKKRIAKRAEIYADMAREIRVIRVDKDQPIPNENGMPLSKFLRTIEVGESFVDQGRDSSNSKIYAAARKLKSRTNGEYSFIARQEPEGLRIWRVKGE